MVERHRDHPRRSQQLDDAALPFDARERERRPAVVIARPGACCSTTACGWAPARISNPPGYAGCVRQPCPSTTMTSGRSLSKTRDRPDARSRPTRSRSPGCRGRSRSAPPASGGLTRSDQRGPGAGRRQGLHEPHRGGALADAAVGPRTATRTASTPRTSPVKACISLAGEGAPDVADAAPRGLASAENSGSLADELMQAGIDVHATTQRRAAGRDGTRPAARRRGWPPHDQVVSAAASGRGSAASKSHDDGDADRPPVEDSPASARERAVDHRAHGVPLRVPDQAVGRLPSRSSRRIPRTARSRSRPRRPSCASPEEARCLTRRSRALGPSRRDGLLR